MPTNQPPANSRSAAHDLQSKFGPYGGQFVPDTLMPALAELEAAYLALRADPAFQAELNDLLRTYVGRPTPLTHARRLTALLGGAQIYLKREDLAHSGAHKINNALGQALLARRMGKRRVIAETGAGQHGVIVGSALINVVAQAANPPRAAARFVRDLREALSEVKKSPCQV